jgi:hypothetical protein
MEKTQDKKYAKTPREKTYEMSRKILEKSSDLLHQFSGHYISHINSGNERGRVEAWNLLEGMAKNYIDNLKIHNFLTQNSSKKYEKDLSKALMIVNAST